MNYANWTVVASLGLLALVLLKVIANDKEPFKAPLIKNRC